MNEATKIDNAEGARMSKEIQMCDILLTLFIMCVLMRRFAGSTVSWLWFTPLTERSRSSLFNHWICEIHRGRNWGMMYRVPVTVGKMVPPGMFMVYHCLIFKMMMFSFPHHTPAETRKKTEWLVIYSIETWHACAQSETVRNNKTKKCAK